MQGAIEAMRRTDNFVFHVLEVGYREKSNASLGSGSLKGASGRIGMINEMNSMRICSDF